MERDIRAWGRRLIGLVNSLAACAAALFFVLGSLSGRLYESMPDLVWPGLAGAGILLLNLYSLIYLRGAGGGATGRRSELIETGPILSRKGGSTVQVSLEALSQGLMLAGQSVSGLSRLQIKIQRPTRRKILVTASFQAVEASALQELGRQLHEALAARFAEMITLDKENRVEYEIVFEGYSGKPPRRQTAKNVTAQNVPVLGGRKDEHELPPFTGPRYPVEPGEEA